MEGDAATPGWPGGRVRTGSRPTPAQMAASLMAVLGLSVVGVGLLLAFGRVDRAPASVEGREAAPAAQPGNEEIGATRAPVATPAPPGIVPELRAWGKEMTPKLFAYTSQVSAGEKVDTREEALAWCAGLTDEVEGMAAVRAAPDPIVESEYRATVSETKEVVAACLNGNGPEMKAHNQAMTRHMQAMLDRIGQLDPDGSADG